MKLVRFLTKELERILSFFPCLSWLLRLYYKKIVEKEIKLGKISNKDKVLCIGGGSVPCTAMEIASKTGAYVEVVDIDPNAVENSQRLIEKLHLDNIIKVTQASGQEIDPQGFSVIHVALQAYPQDKIVKNLLIKSQNNVRILVRSRKTFIESFVKSLHTNCYCSKCNSIEQKYSNTKATLLFIKDKGRSHDEKTAIAHHRGAVGNPNILAG